MKAVSKRLKTTLLVSISLNSIGALAAGPVTCEETLPSHSAVVSQQMYDQDSSTTYNLGSMSGVPAIPAGPKVFVPAQKRMERFWSYGVPGHRLVTLSEAYYKPGTPGTPEKLPNITSTDPRVVITAQQVGSDFTNVTFQGPRNLVLNQVLRLSKAPEADLKRFKETFPLNPSSKELPAAVELQAKLDKAAAEKAASEDRKRADEARNKAEADRLRVRYEQEQKAKLEIAEREAKAREQDAARAREEERQLAIKEKDLSGFEDHVEVAIEYDTSSYTIGGFGMGRSLVRKPNESGVIKAEIERLQRGLPQVSSEIEFNFSKTFFLERPTTKAYSIVLHMKGSRKQVVELIAKGAALFSPAPGNGTVSRLVASALARLDQAYPPKTPVKNWQNQVINQASKQFPGETTNQQNGNAGYGAGSPILDPLPGPGSPTWGG